MEQQNLNLEAIKKTFAEAFINAISAKSIAACAELVLNYEDNKSLEIDYGLSKEAYEKVLLTQSENFLTEKSKFIDEKNANQDSAISLSNFAEIDTYEFEIPLDFSASFIRTISMSMKPRLTGGVNYQVGFHSL